MLAKDMATCPLITSTSAGAMPVYGTCVISMPAMIFRSSPDKWPPEPLPAEAKVRCPGFARAS